MYADKYVSKKEDVPVAEHWAILEFTSIHVPGDERSRTNPGHGYPAHNEPVVKYEAYFTEEKFLAALQQRAERSHGPKYAAFKMTPLTVKTTVSVAVE